MKRALIVVVLLLLLTGCSRFGGQNNNQYQDPRYAKYFEGYDGVQMSFDQLPTQLYYYSNAVGSAANDFPFGIQVWNKGSSYSRGAVFVSGYDPTLIKIDEIPISTSYPGACSLRLGDYSLNQFGMTMQCGDNFAWSGHNGNWLDSIRVRGLKWFDSKILNQLSVDYQNFGDSYKLTFGYDDNFLNVEKYNHGLMLIGLLAGLDFSKFLGKEFLLAANAYDYPGGEQQYTDFNAHLVNWPQGADFIPQHFLATSCYLYTTFAAPMVCIDPAPYSQTRKVCSPNTITYGKGQGAPVAITRVTQESTPRTAVFHFEIQNKGGGTVFDPGMIEKCSPYYPGGAKSSDKDMVWIGSVRIGTQEIRDRCTPSNVVRLQNGKGEFTCSYPIEYADLNSAYQTPIVIELWYGYSNVIDRLVNVKRVT